jgi:hypothetical protein
MSDAISSVDRGRAGSALVGAVAGIASAVANIDLIPDSLLPLMRAARLLSVKQTAVLLRPLTGCSLLEPANGSAD